MPDRPRSQGSASSTAVQRASARPALAAEPVDWSQVFPDLDLAEINAEIDRYGHHRGEPFSYKDAATIVLSRAARFLTSDEIANHALELNLLHTTGATSGRTMNACLHKDIHLYKENSRFYKHEVDRFCLRAKKDELLRAMNHKRARSPVAARLRSTVVASSGSARQQNNGGRRRRPVADDVTSRKQATPRAKRQRTAAAAAEAEPAQPPAPSAWRLTRQTVAPHPVQQDVAPEQLFELKFPYLRTRPQPDLRYPLKMRWSRPVIRPELVRSEPLRRLPEGLAALAHIIHGRLPKMPKDHIRSSVSRDHALVASRPTVDGHTIGGATVRFMSNGVVEIVYFVIWDQHKGFGHQLMERIKRDSAAAGYKWLVTAADDTSKGFWVKEGFSTDVGSVPKSLIASTDVFIYRNAIPMQFSLR